MSSSDANLVILINELTIQFNRYLPLIMYIFGLIGNVLNVLVLSRRTLRSNPCAFTFLISSIASIITIISGLTTRLTAGWSSDLSETNTWLCKIRIVVLFTSRTIVVWLLAYTALDRWFSSSSKTNRRNLSSLKNSYRNIFIISILSLMLNGPLLYCYQANLIGTPAKCYGFTEECRLYTDLSFTFGTIVIPSLFMLVFGLLMIHNIHQSRKRIHQQQQKSIGTSNPPSNPTNPRINERKVNRSLLRMVFVQVIFLILSTAPYVIYKVYITITPIAASKPALQSAIERFLFNLCTNLTYLATAMPFYIFTLCGGKLFRQELVAVFKGIC